MQRRDTCPHPPCLSPLHAGLPLNALGAVKQSMGRLALVASLWTSEDLSWLDGPGCGGCTLAHASFSISNLHIGHRDASPPPPPMPPLLPPIVMSSLDELEPKSAAMSSSANPLKWPGGQHKLYMGCLGIWGALGYGVHCRMGAQRHRRKCVPPPLPLLSVILRVLAAASLPSAIRPHITTLVFVSVDSFAAHSLPENSLVGSLPTLAISPPIGTDASRAATSAMDGDLSTICASEYPALKSHEWLSIRLDPGTRIDYVSPGHAAPLSTRHLSTLHLSCHPIMPLVSTHSF